MRESLGSDPGKDYGDRELHGRTARIAARRKREKMKSTKLQSHFTPDSTLTGLLLLIHRLDQAGQLMGRETILPLAELKLPQIAQTYDSLIVTLVDQELIEGDAEQFVVCPDGMELVHKLSERVSLHALFYNEYYKTVRQSQ